MKRSIYCTYNTTRLSFSVVVEEKGVKMKLTVIDTPGFGDQINNENWLVASVGDTC